MWTIKETIDVPVKEVRQFASGGSSFAIYTLRFAPDAQEPGVRFVTALERPEPEADYWIPFIEEGMREHLADWAREGKPVGHLVVSLVSLRLHPIDSKPNTFKRTAKLATAQALEKCGVEVDG